MYYTYILLSKKDRKHYIGFTSNIEARLEKHYSGKVKSTAYRRPLELIYYEACRNQDDAIRREKYFKTYWGKMYLKKRLKSDEVDPVE